MTMIIEPRFVELPLDHGSFATINSMHVRSFIANKHAPGRTLVSMTAFDKDTYFDAALDYDEVRRLLMGDA